MKSGRMEKLCRCGLLVVIFAVAVRVESFAALKAPYFVKSNQITRLGDVRVMSVHHRSRRAATLSDAEKKEVVDKHNALRREEGATNMEHLVSEQCLVCLGIHPKRSIVCVI